MFMQRAGGLVRQITVQHVIPWLTFSDGPEAGEVTDAAGESVAGLAVWDDGDASETRFFDLQPDSGAAALDAAAQLEIEHEHEHETEEEQHKERESFLDDTGFLRVGQVGILSTEAYKRLTTFDKSSVSRREERRKKWASGVLAIKEREFLRERLREARRRCWRARGFALRMAEKILRIEMEAKVQRFEKWQRSQRKVELYHDRFDTRIAGYTPDQQERLKRYRASLDKQSRFAYEQEKRREEEQRKEALSRFSAANLDRQPVEQSKFTASGRN